MVESSYVRTQVDSVAHEIYIVDSRNKGHDFFHHTIEDVKRTQDMCMGGHKKLRRPNFLLPKQDSTYKRSRKDAISLTIHLDLFVRIWRVYLSKFINLNRFL